MRTVAGPAAEGGVVGHGQVQPHQLEERAGEPLGGPQGEVVDGPEGQQALDGQVAVLELGPPLGRPLVSPRPERLLIDPEGERAPADQGVVVLLPVADAVGGLRGGLASGHRGCGGQGSGEGCGSGRSPQYTEVHWAAEALRATTPMSIVNQIDRGDSQDEYTSAGDFNRNALHSHPWSIGGGGAADLQELLYERGSGELSSHLDEIGFGALTRDDDVFLISRRVALRMGIEEPYVKEYNTGENIRDWSPVGVESAIWPYITSANNILTNQWAAAYATQGWRK